MGKTYWELADEILAATKDRRSLVELATAAAERGQQRDTSIGACGAATYFHACALGFTGHRGEWQRMVDPPKKQKKQRRKKQPEKKEEPPKPEVSDDDIERWLEK